MELLANPNWAAGLILLGILLIYAEFNRPGTVALGCGGALAVMLGMWGLGHATLAAAGLALVVAGVALIAVGCAFPLRGLVSIAGAALLAYGLARLTIPPVHMATALAVAVIFSVVTTWLGRVAMLARRKKQVPGPWDRDSGSFLRIRTPVERVD